MYANTTNGHRPHVSKNVDTKVVQQLIVWGSIVGTITQKAETTVEEWFGLSYTSASGLMEASETSNLNGTRNYLGGATLTQNASSGMPAAYCWAAGCWGTKVTTSLNRMGDTNLYHVQKTTVVYTVYGSGNTTLTLT